MTVRIFVRAKAFRMAYSYIETETANLYDVKNSRIFLKK